MRLVRGGGPRCSGVVTGGAGAEAGGPVQVGALLVRGVTVPALQALGDEHGLVRRGHEILHVDAAPGDGLAARLHAWLRCRVGICKAGCVARTRDSVVGWPVQC